MSALHTPLQQSTVTSVDRHAHLLSKCKLLFAEASPNTILSFGCSEGLEIQTLLTQFPNVARIVGVDLNRDKLASAQELFKNESRVTLLETTEFKASNWTFDFVVCFNVLCNHFSKEGWKENNPISFTLYENCVQELASTLKENGMLCIYGANYSLKHLSNLPADCFLQQIVLDSGPVAIYTPDGKTRMPRGSDLLYVLRRKKNNAATSPQAKQDKPTITAIATHEVKCPRAILIPKHTITLGLLHPGKQSSNLGDYMQTLAQLNVFSVFYNEATWICSPILHRLLQHFAATKPLGPTVRNRLHPCHVRVIWVDRDDSASYKEPSLVHVIANGWYMHADPTSGVFQFPFASMIRPIFVSVHIAHPELLAQSGVAAYLKQHTPIGCRDYATLSLLQKHGISSYFSSCLTTTLECGTMNYQLNSQETLQLDVLQNNATHHLSSSSSSSLTHDEKLDMAFQQLLRYAQVKTLQSSRIHCLLPTRAVSEIPELTFCSRTGGQDGAWMNRSRFSGVSECMMNALQRELMAMALFESVVDRLHNILFLGMGTTQCKNECLDLSCVSDLACSPRDLRLRHPATVKCSTIRLPQINSILTDAYRRKFAFGARDTREFKLRKSPYQAFAYRIDIIVTFDKNYIDVFKTFLKHLSSSNEQALLRIWCLTRQVPSPLPYHKCPFNVVLVQIPLESIVLFSDYTSPLKHVSDVCLDRVLLDRIDFPSDVERVIYLDLDIAVVGSLEPLLHVDSGSKGIVAKTSIVSNVINAWITKYNLQDQLQYPCTKSFNAGVLVMDLSKIRRLKMSDFCLDMYQKHAINDQMLLNFYCNAQYKELPAQFNVFIGQDHATFANNLNTTVVVYHYVGSQKPWLVQKVEDYAYDPTFYHLWHRFQTQKAKKKTHVPG